MARVVVASCCRSHGVLVVRSVVLAVRLVPHSLSLCLYATTVVFVVFNKVCRVCVYVVLTGHGLIASSVRKRARRYALGLLHIALC